jgi:hypothetical protein
MTLKIAEDVMKIRTIWKYLKKGFKHRVAHEKAINEIKADGMQNRTPKV